jgi:AsmA protein
MKIIKILITSLVSLVLIIAVAIGVFTAITDPNDHKEFITSNFNQATGRDLTLAGDIEFTLFPKLGIQLGQTQISNAKGFAQTHFAQLENIIIRADLLSLFMFKLQADTIELHGL